MTLIALVTGASSGFGRAIAGVLARDRHIAYASMREVSDESRRAVEAEAHEKNIDLRAVSLDVRSDASVRAAIDTIIAAHGRIDVLVHNAGHMVFGPGEAFTPDQLAVLYDINVIGCHRVNRAALPHMRAAGRGLLVWIGSSSVAGGVPPLLGPYFAAKAGMDALAVSTARELAPFGIESAIVVPGAFTTGTNHFAHAGAPDDADVTASYAAGWPDGFADGVKASLAGTVPDDADPTDIARAVAAIVAAPPGQRPFRTVIDPASDGAAVAYAVIDRVREQFLNRIGLPHLLRPTSPGIGP